MRAFEQINRKFRGQNAYSEVTSLSAGDLRVAKNVDVYSGEPNDYFLNRRGSEVLVAGDHPQDYKNGTVFAVGDDEYRVFQSGRGFYSQKLTPTPGAPTPISGSVGPEYRITGEVAEFLSDLTITGWNGIGEMGIEIYLSDSPLYAAITLTLDGVEVAFVTDVDADAQPLTGVGIPAIGGSGISATVTIDNWAGETSDGEVLTAYDAGTAVNDIKNANQKIFCFSQEGNSVIYWKEDEERFVARPMGLEKTALHTFGAGDPGDMPETALYYYGIEKVTQRDGADVVASSPNRRFTDGTIPQVGPGFTGGGTSSALLRFGEVGTDASLYSDPYWTHLRLWRSKNIVPDASDPLFPIDAQGVIGQLYEVALITRSEILGDFGAIATSLDLPAGNAGVKAGVATSGTPFVQIEDRNNDTVLSRLVDLDQIDLIPIPPARTGAVHAGRVFVSGINQADIDTDLIEDVLYTTEVYSAYQEQWDPQAFLNAGRNSFKTTMLYSFNDDLLIIREGETKRIPSGNPDAGIQLVDDKIGVQTFLMAGFVTGLGIAAVCSDRYFRYLGFDYRWHSVIGKIDASNAIYPFTKQQAATAASFAYINGKLLMLLVDLENQTDYGLFALAVKEGKGWSEYDYRVTSVVSLFNYSDGLKAAILPSLKTLFEIEVDTDTDSDGEDLEPIAGTVEFAPIQAKTGMIDVSRFSFWGKLTRNASVSAKSSGVEWQMLPTYQQPGLWEAESSLNEREYIFIPQPQTVGTFQWVPLRGQFLSFTVSTVGQFFMSWNRTLGMNRDVKGDLSVFQTGGIIPDGPGWNSQSVLLLNFEDPGSTFYDASGNERNFEWDETGDITNRVTQKPGKGLGMEDAVIRIESDPVTPFFLESNLTFKMAFSLPRADRNLAIFGANAPGQYAFDISPSGPSTFYFSTGTVAYTVTYSGTIPVGTPLVLTLVLLKDWTARFYLDGLTTFAGEKAIAVEASTPFAAPSGPFTRLGGVNTAAILSYFEVVKSAYKTEQAKRFWGTVKAY